MDRRVCVFQVIWLKFWHKMGGIFLGIAEPVATVQKNVMLDDYGGTAAGCALSPGYFSRSYAMEKRRGRSHMREAAVRCGPVNSNQESLAWA